MKNLNVRDCVLALAVLLTLCNTYRISGAKRNRPERATPDFSRMMEAKKSGRGMQRGREEFTRGKGQRPNQGKKQGKKESN
jgi:hypothetical protein